MSNVYKRLQKCRVELKQLPIKESGENKFAGYRYMELGDFLPHIVDLCDTNGLCTIISFNEVATLTVVNSDKPEEQIVFTSPMSTAELKGCHAIQNLGAVETYLRRYLYVAAFDIVEHDALDSTHGKETTKTTTHATKQAAGATNATQGTQGAAHKPLTEAQAKYFPQIKEALDTLYGADVAMKKTLIKRLTTWTVKTGKDAGKVVEGIEDYRLKDGNPLKWLCKGIQDLVKDKAKEAPELCNICRATPCVCAGPDPFDSPPCEFCGALVGHEDSCPEKF